jgi:hypothetical protein
MDSDIQHFTGQLDPRDMQIGDNLFQSIAMDQPSYDGSLQQKLHHLEMRSSLNRLRMP